MKDSDVSNTLPNFFEESRPRDEAAARGIKDISGAVSALCFFSKIGMCWQIKLLTHNSYCTVMLQSL